MHWPVKGTECVVLVPVWIKVSVSAPFLFWRTEVGALAQLSWRYYDPLGALVKGFS